MTKPTSSRLPLNRTSNPPNRIAQINLVNRILSKSHKAPLAETSDAPNGTHPTKSASVPVIHRTGKPGKSSKPPPELLLSNVVGNNQPVLNAEISGPIAIRDLANAPLPNNPLPFTGLKHSGNDAALSEGLSCATAMKSVMVSAGCNSKLAAPIVDENCSTLPKSGKSGTIADIEFEATGLEAEAVWNKQFQQPSLGQGFEPAISPAISSDSPDLPSLELELESPPIMFGTKSNRGLSTSTETAAKSDLGGSVHKGLNSSRVQQPAVVPSTRDCSSDHIAIRDLAKFLLPGYSNANPELEHTIIKESGIKSGFVTDIEFEAADFKTEVELIEQPSCNLVGTVFPAVNGPPTGINCALEVKCASLDQQTRLGKGFVTAISPVSPEVDLKYPIVPGSKSGSKEIVVPITNLELHNLDGKLDLGSVTTLGQCAMGMPITESVLATDMGNPSTKVSELVNVFKEDSSTSKWTGSVVDENCSELPKAEIKPGIITDSESVAADLEFAAVNGSSTGNCTELEVKCEVSLKSLVTDAGCAPTTRNRIFRKSEFPAPAPVTLLKTVLESSSLIPGTKPQQELPTLAASSTSVAVIEPAVSTLEFEQPEIELLSSTEFEQRVIFPATSDLPNTSDPWMTSDRSDVMGSSYLNNLREESLHSTSITVASCESAKLTARDMFERKTDSPESESLTGTLAATVGFSKLDLAGFASEFEQGPLTRTRSCFDKPASALSPDSFIACTTTKQPDRIVDSAEVLQIVDSEITSALGSSNLGNSVVSCSNSTKTESGNDNEIDVNCSDLAKPGIINDLDSEAADLEVDVLKLVMELDNSLNDTNNDLTETQLERNNVGIDGSIPAVNWATTDIRTVLGVKCDSIFGQPSSSATSELSGKTLALPVIGSSSASGILDSSPRKVDGSDITGLKSSNRDYSMGSRITVNDLTDKDHNSGFTSRFSACITANSSDLEKECPIPTPAGNNPTRTAADFELGKGNATCNATSTHGPDMNVTNNAEMEPEFGASRNLPSIDLINQAQTGSPSTAKIDCSELIVDDADIVPDSSDASKPDSVRKTKIDAPLEAEIKTEEAMEKVDLLPEGVNLNQQTEVNTNATNLVNDNLASGKPTQRYSFVSKLGGNHWRGKFQPSKSYWRAVHKQKETVNLSEGWKMGSSEISNLARIQRLIRESLEKVRDGTLLLEPDRFTAITNEFNLRFLQYWHHIGKDEYSEILDWIGRTIKELGKAPIKPKVQPAPSMRDQSSGTSYADKVKAKKGKIDLNSFQPRIKVLDQPFLFEIPAEVEEAAVKEFELTIVGYFPRKHRFNFYFVKQSLLALWGQEGLSSVSLNRVGYYFLRFNGISISRLEELCNLGHINIGGHQLIVEKWDEATDYSRPPPETERIWVVLQDIPAHLFTPNAISCMARSIGRPVYLDPNTEELNKIFYARVFIEITPRSELPSEIRFQARSGKRTTIPVQYAWRPNRCTHCYSFGHIKETCRLRKLDQHPSGQTDLKETANENDSQPETPVSSNPDNIPLINPIIHETPISSTPDTIPATNPINHETNKADQPDSNISGPKLPTNPSVITSTQVPPSSPNVIPIADKLEKSDSAGSPGNKKQSVAQTRNETVISTAPTDDTNQCPNLLKSKLGVSDNAGSSGYKKHSVAQTSNETVNNKVPTALKIGRDVIPLSTVSPSSSNTNANQYNPPPFFEQSDETDESENWYVARNRKAKKAERRKGRRHK